MITSMSAHFHNFLIRFIQACSIDVGFIAAYNFYIWMKDDPDMSDGFIKASYWISAVVLFIPVPLLVLVVKCGSVFK